MIREKIAGNNTVHYYRKQSAASLMKPEHLNENYIAGAKILHVTGITPALSHSCAESLIEAIEIAKRHRVKISFDPNLRLKIWSVDEARKVLLPLLDQVDYFLPGLDELKLLFDTDSIDTIMSKLCKLSAVCVIKGGENKTYILDRGTLSEVPYYKVQHVVDTVGAGDGFCAGFLSGVLRDYDLPDAVALGNLVGSQVIQAAGDWEGLPNAAQVEALFSGKAHIER
ncbi:2-dehydro-3-deoxygluconokinase [compost metagenome]